jgi:hypothetical protein
MAPHLTPTRPRLKPQTQTLLNHLIRAGTITFREAVMDHSIQSLTKRVQELRAAGYPVTSKWKRHPITKQRYTEYALVGRA